MPLGKYYCDYCDKQFQDTPVARKRHLQGLQHLRAKAQWFQSLNLNANFNSNDLYHTSAQPFAKGVCNCFLKTGFCQYGDNCKYFHPKNDSLSANPQAGPAPPPGGVEGAGMGMSWGNLPPSLKPPPEGGYPSLPFVDWG